MIQRRRPADQHCWVSREPGQRTVEKCAQKKRASRGDSEHCQIAKKRSNYFRDGGDADATESSIPDDLHHKTTSFGVSYWLLLGALNPQRSTTGKEKNAQEE